jgi:hypothetical protein
MVGIGVGGKAAERRITDEHRQDTDEHGLDIDKKHAKAVSSVKFQILEGHSPAEVRPVGWRAGAEDTQ